MREGKEILITIAVTLSKLVCNYGFNILILKRILIVLIFLKTKLSLPLFLFIDKIFLILHLRFLKAIFYFFFWEEEKKEKFLSSVVEKFKTSSKWRLNINF